jgi:acetylornithine deacetylase/succinyl-diaminopimelate desuccinylase-like protein
MRLVPDQQPEIIQRLFEDAVRKRCPENVKLDLIFHHGAPAALVPIDSPAMRVAAEALEIGFGKPPAFIREGGSIPVVALFKSVLKADTLLVGFCLPDDRIHSPNEKFDLDGFYGGARTAAALYERLGRAESISSSD